MALFRAKTMCTIVELIFIILVVTNDFLVVAEEQYDLDNVHKGRFTESLSNEATHLVTPRKVTPDGDHVTHTLTHHHNIHGENVHYKIPSPWGSEEYHLELEPSLNFISPALIVEHHREHMRTRRSLSSSSANCHFQGTIRGHNRSSIALSACNGLAGLLRTDHGEFWIEPSKNHEPSEKYGHPHVIFKRNAVQDQHMVNRKRKKKRKRQNSNCGTREPKRVTETKLEWQKLPGKVTVQGGVKVKRHQKRNGNGNGNKQKRNHRRNRKKFNEDNIQPAPRQRKSRVPRSVSSPRHVEALMVADTSMYDFHQDDLEMYLLSIMNMVNSIYQDPTIGNYIHIAVVRIIVQENLTDLNVTANADITLRNFCKWQRDLNFKDEFNPQHHDVAILVTRKDICGKANDPCSTLGVAHVAGMCLPDKSCSVNEDNGITLAHTITHELGHNFGMYHDTGKHGCQRRVGSTVHVMTPSFEADTVAVAWSKCSRRDVTNFLDEGWGQCLEDSPTQQEYQFPDLPAGALFDADHQCRLQFNTSLDLNVPVEVCVSAMEDICKQLWCVVNGSCTTLLKPAAPGTHCAKRKWCQNQACIDIYDEPPVKVDGGWGDWSPWTECSRSCGAGVSVTTRNCSHPSPQHGGSFCIGERSRYKICNTQPCIEDVPSFRAEQCSKHNNVTFNDKLYTWLPYFDKTEPCNLYCTDTDDTQIKKFGDFVMDGTSCNVGTRDMCISGICRKVGCDWVVNSNATMDRCGVCNGLGDTCNTISGIFNDTLGENPVNTIITKIPAKARNIKIEEMQKSRNYIGISSIEGEKLWLNGKRHITIPGEYVVAGTEALYERDQDLEKILIPGPIKEDILVYMIHRGPLSNPGILYEYTTSKVMPSKDKVLFIWNLGEWTLCSQTCGGGVQHKYPICVQGSELISDEICLQNEDRPAQLMRVCNVEPCPEHWWVGEWQLCPVTCKGKVDPYRSRTVMCVDDSEMALPDSHCRGQDKPTEYEFCSSLPVCSGSENMEGNDI